MADTPNLIRKLEPPRQPRVLRYLILGWIGLMGISLIISLINHGDEFLTLARTQARSAFEKDLLYRRWATLHGGVYVPVTEQTPPNPFLAFLPDRDIAIPGGKTLTLVNPAYMTRQVFEMARMSSGERSHLTSLTPLRPANGPDPWEANALRAFERGVPEVAEISTLDGQRFYRFMRPMVTEQGCLKCHADQGYRVGDVRGGISVSIPLQTLWNVTKRDVVTAILTHVIIGGVGLGGLMLGRHRLNRYWLARKAAEQSLVESQRRFVDLMENVDLIGVCLDANGVITFANTYLLKLSGWSREEVVGKNWFELFRPRSTSAEAERVFREGVAHGSIRPHFESEISIRGGERRLIAWNNTMFRDLQGTVVGTSSIGEDITERRRTNDQLREQAALLEVSRDVIIVVDTNGLIQFWNTAAVELYGWTKEEAVGRNLFDLVYDETYPPPVRVREAIFATGDWQGELSQRTKQGEEVIVWARGVLMRDANSQPRAIMLTGRDVREQKRLENQLFRAQRLDSLGSLASGVAHDLNNVFTPILMASESLRSVAQQPNDREMVDLVAGSARRGAAIVKQLLLFARGGESRRGRLDLGVIFGDLQRLLRETFPKGVALDIQVASDLRPILGDPTQLYQAVLNLCLNARDAMPDGGRLTVSVKDAMVDEGFAREHLGAKAGPHVVIRVADTGVGIPDEIRGKIFEPFFSTKPASTGTGLGLAAVQGIVNSHGGFVTVESQKGRGSTFSIYLPESTLVTGDERRESPQVSVHGQGELVLLVEDEPVVRSVVERALIQAKYRVVTAANGAEALAVYSRQGGDVRLVITDLVMPIMDGPQLLRALLQMQGPMPVIAMSGGLGDKHAEISASYGRRIRYLPKPFLAEDILALVHELLENAAPKA